MREQPQPAAPAPDEPEYAELDRRRALRAFDHGVVATIAVALVFGLLMFPVGLTWGMIAAAIGGGWVIGKAVRHGAWRGALHPRTLRLQAFAGTLGVAATFFGFFVAYVAGQVLIDEPDTPLLERISALGFAQYVDSTYDYFHAIALAAMAIMSWRSAR